MWAAIKASDTFWQNIPPYPDAQEQLLRLQDAGIPMVFITNRMGVNPEQQTRQWLADLGVTDPYVVVSEHKAKVCNELGVNYYIDDKNENVLDVTADAHGTLCWMLGRGWNEPITGSIYIDELSEFVDDVLHLARERGETVAAD